MRNIDRIRKMNIEELAAFLQTFGTCYVCSYGENGDKSCLTAKKLSDIKDCEEGLRKYLDSNVEDTHIEVIEKSLFDIDFRNKNLMEHILVKDEKKSFRSMYVEWDASVVPIDNYKQIEELNAKMNALAEQYDCIWDSEENMMHGNAIVNVFTTLSEDESFIRSTKSWFMVALQENDCFFYELFHTYAKEKPKPPTVVMQIKYNQTKKKYGFETTREMIDVYYDFCEENGIACPRDDLFVITAENPLEKMKQLIEMMATDERFLFIVNEWYVFFEDMKIDVLRKVLSMKLLNKSLIDEKVRKTGQDLIEEHIEALKKLAE